MYLLDTNVISEFRKAGSNRANKRVIAWANSVCANEMFLSAISILELEMGVLSMERKDSAQGATLRAWLDSQVLPAFSQRIISVDTNIAQHCAKLHIPNPRPDRDSIIAATALVHGLTLVTRNVNDFKITALDILNPWEFSDTKIV